MSKLIAEIERRVSIIKSEPDGQVRESMIDLLADSLTDFVELESAFSEDVKWIKYPENKPEKTTDHIVTDGHAMMVAKWKHNIWYFYENKTFWSTADVTHFMPLPSAPNNENTEG